MVVRPEVIALIRPAVVRDARCRPHLPGSHVRAYILEHSITAARWNFITLGTIHSGSFKQIWTTRVRQRPMALTSLLRQYTG